MAVVNFLREFVDTWPPDALVDGTITARSATEMTYDSDLGYHITWFGTGLTYDAAGLGAGGTVTRVLVTEKGETIADFQGLSAAMQRMSMFAFGYDREPFKSPIESDSDYLYEYMMRGDDLVSGTFRDDEINAGRGNDVVIAGAGDDYVDFDAGDDHISGGSGWDILTFENANWDASAGQGVALNVAAHTLTDSWGNHDTVSGFEEFRDTLYNDTLIGSGADEDFFITRGDDFVDGGGGSDILNFARADNWGGTKGIKLDLATGVAKDSWGGTDHVQNIHLVVDTFFNDTLRGSALSDTFFGFAGKDFYDGRDGIDALSFDHIDAITGSHGVTVDMTFTKGEVRDDGVGNIENIENIEVIAGSYYGDKLRGGGGVDDFNGLRGNDTLLGRGGDDSLSGGYGRDVIRGGAGKDVLFGDQGADTLTGGAGQDAFRFHSSFAANGVDTITDFVSGTDDLILWAGWIPGHTAIHLDQNQFRSGANATSANTADQRVIYNTTTGDLYLDVDGSGGTAAVKFAVLTDAPVLNFLDIWTTLF